MVNVPSPSPSISLSHSVCVALPLIRVSVPAPSLQAGVLIRSLCENMVGWEPEEKALGEGKCSDTHKHKCLHTYISQSMHAFPCCWGMPLHSYIHTRTYKHSMLVMTVIQLGPTKESDLSAKITFPLSAVSRPPLSCCPLSFDSPPRPSPLGFTLSFPVDDINNRLVAGAAVNFQINYDKYSGHTEETFAGRILISGTDLLKSQHTTIRSTTPLRKAHTVTRVWLSCAGFSISFDC